MLDLLVDHPQPWTVGDLERFPEGEGWKVEVIDGTLVVERDPATWSPWKPEDLARFPECNLFEVIDGLLFVNAQPNTLHQLVADELRAVLKAQLPRELLAVRQIGVSLVHSVVGPDLTVVRRADLEPRASEQRASATALVVEVASPTTQRKDRTIKAEKYAEAGTPGYWRVELDPITVIAYALREHTYAELGRWGAGEMVEVDEPVRVSFDPATLLP